MSTENTTENTQEPKMLSEAEHKEKVEAAIKARFKKMEQEQEALRQENQALSEKVNGLTTNNTIQGVQTGLPDTNSPENAAVSGSGSTLSPDDLNKIVEAKLKQQREMESQEQNIKNVMSIVEKAKNDDPEFKELSESSVNTVPAEHVYEIINSLGEDGLPALKAALKSKDKNSELLQINEPTKLVAWASRLNKSHDKPGKDFPDIPDITGKGHDEDGDIADLVKNVRF